MDLTFALHMLLLRDTEKWIKDGRDKMIEAVKLRAQEDAWKVTKFDNKDQITRFFEDMETRGIGNIRSYHNGNFIN